MAARIKMKGYERVILVLSVMLTWHVLVICTGKVMGKALSVLAESEPSTPAGYTSTCVQARIILIHSLHTNLYLRPTLYPETQALKKKHELSLLQVVQMQVVPKITQAACHMTFSQ